MSSPSDRLRVGDFVASAPGGEPWYEAQLAALGPWYREGMVLLDYGCGNSALGVYLAMQRVDFEYFGIEPRRSPHLASARPNSRIHVGYVGSALERAALSVATCATMGSVATHLAWADTRRILERLWSRMNDGCIAFSCFLSDHREKRFGLGHYPYADMDTWHYVFVTEEQIKDFASEFRMVWDLQPVEFPLGYRQGPDRDVTHTFVRLEF